MKPIDFKQSTKVLQKPSTMTDKECASLHVWSDGKQCVSCWKPTLKERINILFGGKVWLGVLSGGTQPPVFVAGSNVFKRRSPIISSLKAIISACSQNDKHKHFVAGLVISLVLSLLSGFWGGLIAGGLIGGIKEWWDAKSHGNVEFLDFAFTLLGAIAGASLFLLLSNYINVPFNLNDLLWQRF